MKNLLKYTRMGFVLPFVLLMTVSSWSATENVSYIDYYGQTQSKECVVLTQNSDITCSATSSTTSEWYVVKGSVNLNSITCSNRNINIILADGANLTVTGGITVESHSLSIFGQRLQTGSLVVNNSDGAGLKVTHGTNNKSIIGIYGGNVYVTASGIAFDAGSSLRIVGGTIRAQCNGSIAEGDGASNCGSIQTDSIVISWVDSLYAEKYDASTIIASPDFRNSLGGIYPTSSSSDFKAFAGKTVIVPRNFLLHVGYIKSSTNTLYRLFVNGEHVGGDSTDYSLLANNVDVVDFRRKFTPNVYATVMLPFDVPNGTTINAEFYEIVSVVQNGCKWKASAKRLANTSLPERNKPYMIKPAGEKLVFDFGSGKANLCVKTDGCKNGTELVQVSSGNWIFKGLYSNKIWNEEHSELGLAYAYAGTDNPGGAKQGTFGKIASGASAKPFQAYLLKKNSDVKLDPAVCCASMNCSNGHPAALSKSAFEMSGIPETIDVEFIDEDENGEYTTSVGRMNTRTGEFEMLHDYDLKGRKLNGASQARGAYYGKKVLKK